MLERFIADYSEKGYRFAYRLCGNEEDAKELVQETFVRVMRKWNESEAAKSPEAYFLSVLRNLYYDGLRRVERRDACPLESGMDAAGDCLADRLPDGEEGLLDQLAREETSGKVQAAFDSLSAEHRAVLSLSDIEGLDYEQIAAVLDCPAGTVKSRLSRARRALKSKLLDLSEVMNP